MLDAQVLKACCKAKTKKKQGILSGSNKQVIVIIIINSQARKAKIIIKNKQKQNKRFFFCKLLSISAKISQNYETIKIADFTKHAPFKISTYQHFIIKN